MSKIISAMLCVLLLIGFLVISAESKEKRPPKKGKPVGPYISKTLPPPGVLGRMCKMKPDQVIGKIQTGPDQYSVYMAVLGRPGVVNAQQATLVKLDNDAWILGCFGSLPQVVLK